MAIGQELLNVPMGDMIRQMALAIAEGQVKLDGSSIEVAEMMGGLKVITDAEGKQTFDDSRIFFGYDMPDVRGLKGAQADTLLAARGLSATFVSAEDKVLTTNEAAELTVQTQDAAPRTLVTTTNAVRLFVK